MTVICLAGSPMAAASMASMQSSYPSITDEQPSQPFAAIMAPNAWGRRSFLRCGVPSPRTGSGNENTILRPLANASVIFGSAALAISFKNDLIALAVRGESRPPRENQAAPAPYRKF
jgi:hypothetical protein